MNADLEVSWDELPATVTAYLTAHRTHDVEAVVATFTSDATVTDEGRTHRGHDEIRAWLGRTSSEYTYTTTFTGASLARCTARATSRPRRCAALS